MHGASNAHVQNNLANVLMTHMNTCTSHMQVQNPYGLCCLDWLIVIWMLKRWESEESDIFAISNVGSLFRLSFSFSLVFLCFFSRVHATL